MTRFARASGSKSSNEKRPEEATSWEEMRNAILNKGNTERPVSPPFRFETKDEEPKEIEWASLGDDNGEDSLNLLRQHLKSSRNNTEESVLQGEKNERFKKNNKKKIVGEVSSDAVSEMAKKAKKIIADNKETVNMKKVKKRKMEEVNEEEEEGRKQKKKKKLLCNNEDEGVVETEGKKKKKKLKIKEIEIEENQNVGQGNKKRKKLKKKENFEKKENGFEDNKKKMKKLKGKEYIDEDMQTQKKNKAVNGEERGNKNDGGKKQFNKRLNGSFKYGNSSFGNKKFNSRNRESSVVQEIIVNGEKVPVVKFQGFNVLQEDAERLRKLKQDMINEGIPKAKLNAALKLERRRAEKALSRLKKAVCFHCRGSGHLLSNCPMLTENQNTGTGICYKCGSTEHSASECKVVRGTNFQFAECFICKEQGHIARQCPDNPRGLYPQGGACRECGDVTHLRKDCPKVVSQKTEEIATVGVRNDRNLECLDEEISTREQQEVKKPFKRKSTVKF